MRGQPGRMLPRATRWMLVALSILASRSGRRWQWHWPWNTPPAALVLRSPFTSLADMGRLLLLPIAAHQSAPARSLRLAEADWTPVTCPRSSFSPAIRTA